MEISDVVSVKLTGVVISIIIALVLGLFGVNKWIVQFISQSTGIVVSERLAVEKESTYNWENQRLLEEQNKLLKDQNELLQKQILSENPIHKNSKYTSKDYENIFEFKPSNSSKGFFILNVIAVDSKTKAKEEVRKLEQRGYNASFLWIPDYRSLSKAPYYTVFIGPFKTQNECEEATEKYRKIDPNAYGLWVGNQNKRIEIRGVNRVRVINNYHPF